MSAAIGSLRARAPETPIAVTHTDIPNNDFISLFELLAGAQSYLVGSRNVFAYAAGKSFYERPFPAHTQTIGWNSIAVHWLSSVPAGIRNDMWSWKAFLDARAVEFRKGGQIVVAAQYATMAIPTYYRTRAEFEAPFHEADCAFTLLESAPVVLADPFWPAFEQTHDAAAFAQAYTAWKRALLPIRLRRYASGSCS